MKYISRIFYFLLIISLFVLGYFVTVLNILPNKYYFPVIILIGLIVIFIGLFVFNAKKFFSNFILFIILLGLIGVSSYASYYLFKTNNFINNIGDVKKEEVVYYVIVKKDSDFKDVKDLENKEIGTYSFNAKYYDKAYEKLSKKVSFTEKSYEDVNPCINDLLDNKVSALFMSASHKQLLDEEYSNFKDNTKVLYEVKILVNKDKTELPSEFLNKTFNVYISGIDTDGSINTVSRSDVNIVMTINPVTKEVLLTTIPRDYYVRLHDTTGYKDKLTHAGIYGVDMSRQTIEDLLDTKIDYYVRVNFTTLVKVIDTIGGIDVYSDQAFNEYGFSYVEGINHLNGKQALMFSRIRHVFGEGDRKRGMHQQAVIEAIINKVSSSKTLLLNYTGILNSLSDSFETNVSSDMIKEFVKLQLNELPSWKIKSISLDGYGDYDYTYSMPGRTLYVMVPNEDTINNAKKYITGLEENKTFEEIDNPVVETDTEVKENTEQKS